MAMSTLIPSSSASEYQDGLAFRFKLPKGTGLSLRAVDVKDGVPKLRFSTSHKVPSITEEDVAVCIRLCLDNKRPEFFYKQILPNHPFAVTKRHYKYYKPSYLKGTSVGELFAESDWKMKCVHVGVMSDENKETFKSLRVSKLGELATREDFPRDEGSAQILMTCESVDVNETENELIFVGKPHMKISDSKSPTYTSYTSKNFNYIAENNEPCFLKMMEIVKLMVAVEWLRDSGVKFSEEWIKEHVNQPKSGSRKSIQVSLSHEEQNIVMEQLQGEIDSVVKELPSILNLPSTGADVDTTHPKMSLIEANKVSTDSGVEFKLETKHIDPVFKEWTDGLEIPVVTRMVARITFDDYEFLLRGIDPNQPVTIDKDDGLIKPDISSWSEFPAETMPFPCKVIEGPESEAKVLTGGCTTSTIPIRKTDPPIISATETAQVRGSTSRKAKKVVLSASNRSKYPPPGDVCIERPMPTVVKKKDVQEKVGWTDSTSRSLFSPDGKVIEQTPSLKGLVQIQQLIGGKEVGEPIMIHMHLRRSKA